MLILQGFLRIYVNLHSAFQLLLNNRVTQIECESLVY
nr:MAG TPA: hypothetical protein [Caudoviricetes sp.]DAS39366.1 MAG TPA: hypothetical protein [Caudoviricetes sp.]